jgi:ribonuclease G
MAKEMIISSNGFERKIAILDDGVLTEYYVERIDDESEGMVGNIYKGRVTKVLPGMQSAFVSIGLERDAFLYVADVFEGEEVEYETPARESKRAASAPKAAEVTAPAAEEVTDEEMEGILEAIAQTETRPRSPGPEADRLPLSQRDYDEQVAQLIESLAEDLIEPVSDEEGAPGEVDLKDAIIEEKLIEAVHQEEMAEELVEESPPVAEVRVGSIWTQFPSDSSLERIVDEPLIKPETGAAPPVEVLPGSTELAEVPLSSVEPIVATDQPPETGGEVTRAPETSERRSAAPESAPPLEDAEAAVRHRSPRAEFAAHRKVRRRRSDRSRQTEGNGGDTPASPEPTMPTITELLHEGQELLVQLAKEPIGAKGARVTSHIALPGRYLVYMPTTEHVGVSRRIPSHTERIRLRKAAAKLRARQKASGGFIVRTAAEGCTEDELLGDMQYLLRVWNDIRRRAEQIKAPALLYREVDLVQRILRDRLSGDFTAIRVDNEQEYTQIIDFVDHFQPDLLSRVKLYTRSTPIFEQYGVQSEIDKCIRPRVWLKSGGYIVINQTEALVAIDVNTGKFVGKTNRFEDTITRTNMEAAKEIARQIRLRDLGGIIVLDFIDMEERKNRQKVMQVLEDELKRDRAPAKVLSFNDFGLVAITRKRVKQSLERTLCEPCPHCHGSGMVKSPQTVCYEILDEARRITDKMGKGKEIVLRVHPTVAQALQEKYSGVMEAIESQLKKGVIMETDPLLHQEQFDLALL